MDKLHERALRLVYRDEISAYEDLLRKDGSSKIHHRNIHKLAIEILKFKNGLSPPIMNEIFINGKTHNYYLSQEHINDPGNIRHVFNGTETIRYRAQKTWEMVPEHVKKCKSLMEFKIKTWIPDKCSCRICKTYIAGVEFID